MSAVSTIHSNLAEATLAKQVLRSSLKSTLASLPNSTKQEKSSKIVSALRGLLLQKSASIGAGQKQIWGSFLPLPSEPDLRPLDPQMAKLENPGEVLPSTSKTIEKPNEVFQAVNKSHEEQAAATLPVQFAYPVVTDQEFYFVMLKSGKAWSFQENAKLKVREPDFQNNSEDFEVVPAAKLSGVLVPGLGFDASGGRLGRGKGYYDRVLADVNGEKIGICFEEQFLLNETVPLEAHDVRMTQVVTDLGIRLHS